MQAMGSGDEGLQSEDGINVQPNDGNGDGGDDGMIASAEEEEGPLNMGEFHLPQQHGRCARSGYAPFPTVADYKLAKVN